MSKNTQLVLQGTLFSIDLHILPIHGPDVILGMEWLESLGRVTTDYTERSMEFTCDNDLIVLNGVSESPKRLSLNSLASLMSHVTLFKLYELVQVAPPPVQSQTDTGVEFPPDLPSAVAIVLRAHAGVF